MRFVRCFAGLVLVLAMAVPRAAADAPRILDVFAAYATPIEEPWNTVLHRALTAAHEKKQVRYTWKDRIGTGAAMEKVLRLKSEKVPPDIIFGDAFGSEKEVRRVAADFPRVPFVFGSGQPHEGPNLSVFDSALREPAYVCGIVAGRTTVSNVLGVVAGYPEPTCNETINAFIQGARSVNVNVKVKVTFIESWYDPAKAKKAAEAQIAGGADIIFAERAGAIGAATAKGAFAIGHLTEPGKDEAEKVLASALWDLTPTVQAVLAQVAEKKYSGRDLRTLTTMKNGGAKVEIGTGNITPTTYIQAKRTANNIRDGRFEVGANAEKPKSD